MYVFNVRKTLFTELYTSNKLVHGTPKIQLANVGNRRSAAVGGILSHSTCIEVKHFTEISLGQLHE